jgi:hypothetical protein
MTGVGLIYRQFRSGQLTDDDEVAVLHGPAELDYVALTEAMVNVRVTVDHALASHIVSPDAAAILIGSAKSLFYKERTWELIIERAAGGGLAAEERDRFAGWLAHGKVNQKRLDAEEMLGAIVSHMRTDAPPFQATFEFAHTFAWEEARQMIEQNKRP